MTNKSSIEAQWSIMGLKTEPMMETVKLQGGHVITTESGCSGTIVCYSVLGSRAM